MTTETEAVTWNPFAGQTTTADASTSGQHSPLRVWDNIPRHQRYVPQHSNWIDHLAEVTVEGWTPPLWLDENKSDLKHRAGKYPVSPPMEAGQKALVLDDWGNTPKVVEVVGLHNNHLVAKYGAATLYATSWLALTDDAVLSGGIAGAGPRKDALTEEEAAALDAEFEAWSHFLGYRAHKYGWCGTFENILKGVGIEPWRPGFKTVTLSVQTTLEPSDEMKALIAKSMGGDVKFDGSRVTTQVVLADVSRADYNGARWDSLLTKAGYKNFSQVRVLDNEPMEEEAA